MTPKRTLNFIRWKVHPMYSTSTPDFHISLCFTILLAISNIFAIIYFPFATMLNLNIVSIFKNFKFQTSTK